MMQDVDGERAGNATYKLPDFLSRAIVLSLSNTYVKIDN
jgi:hypothetical protein